MITFVTADQIVAHAIGDYLLQSDWMANHKRQHFYVALVHAYTYGGPFLLFQPSAAAMVVIIFSHAIIDRFGLARYLVWAKNWLGLNRPWAECTKTGYPDERPPWMSVWLMIIADNILHILINAAALRWL